MDIQSLVLDYVGLIPVVLIGAAFTLPVFSLFIKSKRFYDVYAFVFSFLAFIMSLIVSVKATSSGRPLIYPFGGWPPPIGVIYEVDAFSSLLGLLATSIMLLVVIYSWWYLEKSSGYVWYYALLLGLEGGMIGCLYTGDAFNLFVMIEVLSISAYGLVAFYRSRLIALEAAMKYAFIGAVATTMYFVALLFIYGAYGTLNMADIAIRVRTLPPTSLWGNVLVDEFSRNTSLLAVSAMVATVLALWAFTYKAALFPNHFWLPDAHPEAPTPISAALSGLVVGVGVYAVIRWLYTIFGPDSLLGLVVVSNIAVRDALLYVLMVLGVVSSIMAALLMVVQVDVKRLLAYSTISHIGLMFMALSVGLSSVPESVRILALTATLYHLINHGVGKSLLFMSAGVLIEKSGTRYLSEWNGIGRKYPLATSALIIGAFNLIGIPPLGGFFSKLMMFQAFVNSNMMWLAIVLVVESVISLTAYIKLINAAVYSKSAHSNSSDSIENYPKSTLDPIAYMALWILALACVALGILYVTGYIPVNLFKYVYASLSSNGTWNYINAAREFVISYFSAIR